MKQTSERILLNLSRVERRIRVLRRHTHGPGSLFLHSTCTYLKTWMVVAQPMMGFPRRGAIAAGRIGAVEKVQPAFPGTCRASLPPALSLLLAVTRKRSSVLARIAVPSACTLGLSGGRGRLARQLGLFPPVTPLPLYCFPCLLGVASSNYFISTYVHIQYFPCVLRAS